MPSFDARIVLITLNPQCRAGGELVFQEGGIGLKTPPTRAPTRWPTAGSRTRTASRRGRRPARWRRPRACKMREADAGVRGGTRRARPHRSRRRRTRCGSSASEKTEEQKEQDRREVSSRGRGRCAEGRRTAEAPKSRTARRVVSAAAKTDPSTVVVGSDPSLSRSREQEGAVSSTTGVNVSGRRTFEEQKEQAASDVPATVAGADPRPAKLSAFARSQRSRAPFCGASDVRLTWNVVRTLELEFVSTPARPLRRQGWRHQVEAQSGRSSAPMSGTRSLLGRLTMSRSRTIRKMSSRARPEVRQHMLATGRQRSKKSAPRGAPSPTRHHRRPSRRRTHHGRFLPLRVEKRSLIAAAN